MTMTTLLPQLQQAIDNQQNVFALLNKISDSQPLMHFSSSELTRSEPLWLGTQYREWFDVMPVLIQLPVTDPLIEWLEQERPVDWGMFIVSPFHFDDVYRHLQSLTQVWLPNGSYAFFRLFDPRFSVPIAQQCNEQQRAELMGPTSQWLSYQHQVIRHDEVTLGRVREFPWWDVPVSVMKALDTENTETVVSNLIKDLEDFRPDLFLYFPLSLLKAKAQRFARNNKTETEHLLQRFIHDIEQDVQL
ncbi:TPA: DUF4123 domain-containing protein [Photobacterium damselae]